MIRKRKEWKVKRIDTSPTASQHPVHTRTLFLSFSRGLQADIMNPVKAIEETCWMWMRGCITIVSRGRVGACYREERVVWKRKTIEIDGLMEFRGGMPDIRQDVGGWEGGGILRSIRETEPEKAPG
jgi:hypothetical protein